MVTHQYGWRPDGLWGIDPLYLKQGGQSYYYHNDHLGTPQKLVSVTGEVAWEAHYAAFGDAQALGTVENPLRFPGQYYDAETGMHYNYYRYYDPSTGQYMTSDPIGLQGGLNTFGYALQNPLKYFDPDGLEVRFICRLLAGVPGGKKHCFVYVECPEEGWGATLSLFSNDFMQTGRKEIRVRGSRGFGARDNPDSSSNTDDITIFPKEQKCGTCEYEKRVLNEYYSFPSGDLPYSIVGPNSNTFAQTLINNSGGSWGGEGVSNAPGMRR